ncbi:hypothetical protein Ndes2526B_g05559 [Nannochloris sp. 'desiccata']
MFAVAWLPGFIATTAAACACSCCTLATKEALKSSARVAWSILFTFSLLLSWLLRDFAKPLISKIPWIVKQFAEETPPDEWFGQQAVYRLSMGNFILFMSMAIIMSFPAPVKYKSDWRDAYLHHGSWAIKAASKCLLSSTWPTRGNEAWVAEGEEDPRYLYALLGATIFSYALSFTTAGVAYHWFAPASHDCSLNITLITLTVLVIIVLTAVTLHPRIKQVNPGASIFVSGCTALYCSYLSFAALQSEPRDYECNTIGQKLSAASGTTLAAGMMLTLISTVWAAFRAGSNTRTFATGWEESSGRQPLLDEELTSAGIDGVAVDTNAPQSMATMKRTAHGVVGGGNSSGAPGTAMAEFVPVSYSYLQFYLVFALASMYLAMLMTGWGSGGEQKDQIDVGWTSVWVKSISSWAVAGLYCWTLLAPALFPDREFSF